MPLSLKPQHLKRYKDAGRLLLKYAGTDFADLEEGLPIDDAPGKADEPAPKALELANDLERLGPTYIKLGQLLSTRVDLIPPAYIEALSRLQDDVEPFSYEEVERIVHQELGLRISKAFHEFESEPIAAASLGQVHRARLRDGRQVAVKVQRPGIRGQIAEDLEAFRELAKFLDMRTEVGKQYQFLRMFEEFRRSLIDELDYRREAANLEQLGDNLAEFELIVVPKPVEDYTTSRLLTMEFVAGRKVTDLSKVARTETDFTPLLEQLQEAYLKQVVVDGFFHADPHPGNVFLTEDGRIALIDLGMVARVSPRLQEHILKLLLVISEGRGEEAADTALEMSERLPHFDEPEFRRRIEDLVRTYQDATLEEIQVGRIVMRLTALSIECGVRAPAELTMLGKALLNLDEIARVLDPEFDPNESIRRHAAELFNRRIRKSFSPGKLMSGVMEAKEFFDELPGRTNRILENLANNELEIKVDAIDERHLTEGFQKIANRIATGVILAALIIGAAMLMQVETEFTVFGYPGLAMISFLAAAAGGIALLVEIYMHDRRDER